MDCQLNSYTYSCLPPPQPIHSDLVTLGVSPGVAQRMSSLYLQRAEALKKATETIMRSESVSIPCLSDCMESESLLQRLFAARRRNYEATLRQWFDEATDVARAHFCCSNTTQINSPSISSGHNKSSPFKPEYLPLFEYAFSKDRFPSREDKKHLARISGMTYRQVSVWFQNRRCRSGKVNAVNIRPVAVGRLRKSHYASLQSSNLAALDWVPGSSSCIDLTGDDDRQVLSPPFFAMKLKTETINNHETRSPTEKTSPVPSIIDVGSSCQFPAPYKPKAVPTDLFAMKIDPSLWSRNRMRKRPRFSERVIVLDEIVQDTRNMIIGDRTGRRDTESLPKRHSTSLTYPMTRFPFTPSSRRTTSSSTGFSDISISTSSHLSSVESIDWIDSSENCTGLWNDDRHDKDEPPLSPIYLSDNSSSESFSSVYNSSEFYPGSLDSGEESDFTPCQKDTDGLKLGASGYVRSSIQKPEIERWGKLLAVIPSYL